MKGTYCFHHIVEVALCAQHAPRPADDPVAIWYKPCALGRTAFEHIENVPNVVHCKLGFAHAHAEAKQRRLPLCLGLLGIGDVRMG